MCFTGNDFHCHSSVTYKTASPTYETPSPPYETPTPTYETPSPTYETPSPTYKTASLTYQTPSPTYQTAFRAKWSHAVGAMLGLFATGSSRSSSRCPQPCPCLLPYIQMAFITHGNIEHNTAFPKGSTGFDDCIVVSPLPILKGLFLHPNILI